MKLKDLTGRRFSTVIVQERAENAHGKTRWRAVCDCGNTVEWDQSQLKNNKSCGCMRFDLISKALSGRVIKHGRSKSPEFWIWCSMLKRCRNKSEPSYKDYGGRGITVCDRWNEFTNFYSDMGDRPSRIHSLDRRDNNGPYSPDNCRWATRYEQSRNKRQTRWITIGEETLCLKDWAIRLGISTGAFYYRLRKGMTETSALGLNRC